MGFPSKWVVKGTVTVNSDFNLVYLAARCLLWCDVGYCTPVDNALSTIVSKARCNFTGREGGILDEVPCSVECR